MGHHRNPDEGKVMCIHFIDENHYPYKGQVVEHGLKLRFCALSSHTHTSQQCDSMQFV